MTKMSCEHSRVVSVQRQHASFFPFFFSKGSDDSMLAKECLSQRDRNGRGGDSVGGINGTKDAGFVHVGGVCSYRWCHRWSIRRLKRYSRDLCLSCPDLEATLWYTLFRVSYVISNIVCVPNAELSWRGFLVHCWAPPSQLFYILPLFSPIRLADCSRSEHVHRRPNPPCQTRHLNQPLCPPLLSTPWSLACPAPLPSLIPAPSNLPRHIPSGPPQPYQMCRKSSRD